MVIGRERIEKLARDKEFDGTKRFVERILLEHRAIVTDNRIDYDYIIEQ